MIPTASITVVRNPLRLVDREVHEVDAGGPFIDWLIDEYPNGFGRPIVVVRNGQPVDLADCDFRLKPDDAVAILVGPGLPASFATLLLVSVLTSAAMAVLTLALNLIFGKPSRPKSQDAPAADPIYSITGSQNAARIGDPIPALYGRMITVPDYGSQPYTFFFNNDQYLDQILVIGWGEFELHDVRVGETPVSALEGDAVEYWLFDPADHGSTMGPIETLTGVQENIVSSPEVADQELNGQGGAPGPGAYFEWRSEATFTGPATITLDEGPTEDVSGYSSVQVIGTAHNNGVYELVSVGGGGLVLTVTGGITDEDHPGDKTFRFFDDPGAIAIGPFVTCAPGKTGNRIYLDLIFPQGLFEVDDESGAFVDLTVALVAEYQQISDSGAPVGGWTAFPISVTRRTNTPVRLTYAIDVAPGRYRVRMSRTTPPPASTSQSSNLVWVGLKFRLVPSAFAYGPLTLLVVRIRATNGIAGQASTRISADVTRKLPHLGTGPLVPTTSPADAFVDVFTNPIYGGRRPLAEVDVGELAMLEDHWAGGAEFNGGFAQRSTIWEALKMTVQTAAASPLPLGQVMSVAQDGVKAVRSQLFSDANTIRGSLDIGYNFDRPGDYDGFQVEYRDPATWNPLSVTWPVGALDPDLVQLFGCTSEADALGFAKLLWNKRLLLRKTVTFETEMEGLIPRLGDRIAVAASLPRWGKSGVVVGVAGLTLTLDDLIDWGGEDQFIVLRDERGNPSDPIPVTPGPGRTSVVLAFAPPFPLFGTGTQEPTHYAMGQATSVVADFTVANMEHRGGTRVAIEAICYNPNAFAGTLPWLEVPV